MYIDDVIKNNFRRTKNLVGIGTSSKQDLWNGIKLGSVLGGGLSLGLATLEVTRAQRGEVVPTMLGAGLGLVSAPAISAAVSASVVGLASAIGCTPPGLAIASGIAAMYLDVAVVRAARRGIRCLTDSNKALRHFETGGNYNDRDVVKKLRYQALSEMSGAISSNRNHLGMEALALHK